MKTRILIVVLSFSLLTAPLTLRPTRAQSSDLVTFPSPEVEFIIGPQVKINTSDAKGAAWFDSNAVNRGLSLCAEFPHANVVGSTMGPGTITLTQGSAIVKGTGTKFLTTFPSNTFFPIAFNGKYRQPLFITGGGAQSDTQVTLNQPWPYPTVTEEYGVGDANFNLSEGPNYYDFGLTAYTNYYRTGDVRFRDCARKVTDSWYASVPIDNGRSTAYENGAGYAPRQVSMDGLMLRALDGRQEMWMWIVGYTRNQYDTWIGNHIKDAGLWFGVREGGFLLRDCAVIAATHPDPAIRAEFRDRALNAAVNYYARLQQPDGSWRWNADGAGGYAGSEQPFMIGILNEGLIGVHRLTGNETVKNTILKSVTHEFTKSYNPNGWRALYYLLYGSWNDGPSCATGCGAAANPWPAANPNDVSDARQLNATTIHQYGWAFAVTGDPKFKTWGDEIFDATFSGADGFRGYAANRAKEYDESYRSASRHLAYRISGATSTPSPVPTPTPTPIPSPSPTPTPVPTPLPTPVKTVYETSYPSANSDNERQAKISAMAALGWSCTVNPGGRFLICLRPKQ